MTYKNAFIRPARQLRSKGKQLGQFHQLAKGSGLILSALAGVGCVASSGPVIPLVVGLVTYAGAVLSENQRTGKLKPLPGLDDDLGAIAARSLGQDRGSGLATQPHHYLEPEDKALFYLTNFQGHKLTELAEGMEPELFEHVLTNLVDHLIAAHQDVLNFPELVGEALEMSFFDDAIAALPRAVSAKLPALEPEPARPMVGARARLDIVNVEAVAPSGHTAAISQAQAVKHATTALQQPKPGPDRHRRAVNALETLLSSPFESKAIFGAQRTGKSYLAAVASAELAAQGTNVFHINLASYGGEDGRYWQHATDSVTADISSLDSYEAGVCITDAIELVHRFYVTENSILVVDELAYLGSKSNAHAQALGPLMSVIADKISTLSSTGIKRRKAIWTIAPEFVASGLVKDALAVKKLALVLVAIAPGHSVEWQSSALSFNAELYAQISNNFPVTEPTSGFSAERIAYVGGRWMPVGVDGSELESRGSVPAVAATQQARSVRAESVPATTQQQSPRAKTAMPDDLAAIVDYSRAKGWVTARGVVQGVWALKGVPAAEIRAMFVDLVIEHGLGAIRGDGPSLEWNLNPQADS